jgi:hypothetical protein
MNRYQPHRPTAVLGAAAVLVSTLVLALAVAVPVGFAPPPDARVLARIALPIEVAIEPSRIEVVGLRERQTAQNDVQPIAMPAMPQS